MSITAQRRIIPIQPMPVETAHLVSCSGQNIFKRYLSRVEAGDIGRCRLCRECFASNDRCLVVIDKFVRVDGAPLATTSEVSSFTAERIKS